MVVITDSVGIIEYVNPKVLEVTGYSPEELIGQNPRILQSGQTSEQEYEALWGTITSGHEWHGEIHNKGQSGIDYWVSARISPIHNRQGTITHYIAIQEDITELKQAEAALKQHAARLEILHMIDKAILAAKSPQAISQGALTLIGRLVPCAVATVELFDFERREVKTLAVRAQGDTLLTPGDRTSFEDYGVQDIEELVKNRVHRVDDLQAVGTLSKIDNILLKQGISSYVSVPLFAQGVLFGTLNLGADASTTLTAEHIEVAREVASQLAVAIRQAQLREREREQRLLAEALSNTAAVVSKTLDLDEVLYHVLENVQQVVSHDLATVMLITGDRGWIAQHRGFEEHDMEDVLLFFEAQFELNLFANLNRIMRDSQPVIIADIEEEPDPAIFACLRSYVGVPIRSGNKTIAILNLDSKYPEHFRQEDVIKLQAFADQVGIAIRNARMYEAEHRQRIRAESLVAAAKALSSSLTLEDVLDAILDQLGMVVGYDSATLQILEGDELVIQSGAGFNGNAAVVGLRFALDSKFPNTRVFEDCLPIAFDDIRQSYPHFRNEADTYESAKIRSWLGVPLLVNDHLIGMIALDRWQVHPFTNDEIQSVVAFASQVGLILENSKLYHELETYSGFLEEAIEKRTAELRRTKDRVETILNFTPDPMLVLNSRGEIQTANPAFEKIFGYHIDTLHGKLPSTLISPDQNVRMRDALQHVIDQLEVRRVELVAQRRDGTTFDADIALAPVKENYELQGVVCILRDISLLKEVARMKDAFVSNVSHELRTPITGLKLNHHLIQRDPQNQERYLGRLGREIDRLNTLIEDLLRLSRLEQGRVEMKLEPVSLSELAVVYVEDRKPLAENKQLRLGFFQRDEVPIVQADRGLLGQALSVLLTNALEYTPTGGTITVETCLMEAEGQPWAGLCVKDTGPGILPEDEEHLFERFYRGQVGRDSGAAGTGLGLSIAKEIVARHRGRIEVSSILGEGTTFFIWLPAELSAEASIGAH